MERILGIDTGTNSLGWAIVEKEEGCTRLVAKGTNIFSEGVKIEKGLENAGWYDLSGRRLTARPTLKGVYIMNGKKYIIK